MKFSFIAAVLTLSSSAFANYCEVDMVDNYNRVISTFRSYDSYDGCKESMKACRKEIRVTNRVGRADCVRATSVPAPMPTPPAPRPTPPVPVPLPVPVPPMPGYGVTATGHAENQLFEFYGRDASELYINCVNEMPRVRSLTGKIDDLFYTVNNDSYKSAYNSSSYYTDLQICSILEQEARSSYGHRAERYTRVLGTLETSTFNFEGYTRNELLNQCHSSITNLRLGNTDDMAYSINGSYFKNLHNSSSYWKSPAEVCRVMLKDMDSQISY